VLAVAYNSGKILLCDIENSASVHTFQIGSSPTTLLWSAQSKSVTDQPECFQDLSSQFLPNLPAFEKGYFACVLVICNKFVNQLPQCFFHNILAQYYVSYYLPVLYNGNGDDGDGK